MPVDSGPIFATLRPYNLCYLMKKIYLPFVLMILLPVFINSCAFSHYDRLTTHYDQIKKEKRINLKMFFLRTEERYTSFYSSEKNFLKVINAAGQISYRVYDQLNLSPNSFPLSDTIFLIVDDQAYPVKIGHQETETFHRTETQSDQIMNADSTTVTVISSIQGREYKNIQFQYTLNQQEINAFQNAKTAAFLYYANPEIFTLKIPGHTLRKLKKFFAMQ